MHKFEIMRVFSDQSGWEEQNPITLYMSEAPSPELVEEVANKMGWMNAIVMERA